MKEIKLPIIDDLLSIVGKTNLSMPGIHPLYVGSFHNFIHFQGNLVLLK